jgi:signal transduction histidine kinase/CheY-like chemotaxis protein
VLDVAIALVVAGVIALIDFLTGTELAFSLFYLIPVGFLSWRRGIWPGLAIATLCTVLWFLMERFGGQVYSVWIVAYWNAAVRGGIFVITAVLLSSLNETLKTADAAKDSALDASRAKSEFLSAMSHEIRTPLNAILAMADTLAETRLSPDQAEYVRIFRQEGRRLLTLINGLLDTAKVEAGRMVAEQISFSVKDLLAEVASIAGAQVRAKGLSFDLESGQDLPLRLIGDPLLLRRTLINLVGNAAKFTLEGGVTVRMVREPSAPDRFLYFSVTDTGVGIDPEAQKRLFMPFSQADSTISRRFGGTGLGLNLCKRFVELMGGTIGVTSRLGEGSQFWFTLPLVIPEEGADSGGNELESAEPRVLRRPLRILLVEDYDVNRAIVRTYLKEMPYTVDEAENGEVGVAKMKAGRYDLVLMDIHMPVMDGYTATRTIRAWEQERGLKRTPIVALTAHAYDEDIRASTNAGCDHHLTKPFTKKALLEAICDAVGDEQGEVSIQEEIEPDIRA